MGNITVGQIVTFVIGVSAFIGAVTVIATAVSKIYSNQVKKIIDPLCKDIKSIDISQCKNFLVRFLADVEQGNEIDEVEKERAFEVYEHYIALGGNSYIHNKWDKLMKK